MTATPLVAAAGNPQRLRREAAFASPRGANPVPASSGRTDRHRLNRGGHRIVIIRLRHDERTRAYMRRRASEGMGKKEVIRRLKRCAARGAFSTPRKSDHMDQSAT